MATALAAAAVPLEGHDATLCAAAMESAGQAIMAVAAVVLVPAMLWPELMGDAQPAGWLGLSSTTLSAAAVALCVVVFLMLACTEPMVVAILGQGRSGRPIVLGLSPPDASSQDSLIGRAARSNYLRSQCESSWFLSAALRLGFLGDMTVGPREDIAVAAEAVLAAQASGPDVTDHLALLSDATLVSRVALLAELFAGSSEGQRLFRAHGMLVAETERLASLLEPVMMELSPGCRLSAAEGSAERAWGVQLDAASRSAAAKDGGTAASPGDSSSDEAAAGPSSASTAGAAEPSDSVKPLEPAAVKRSDVLVSSLDALADAVLLRWPALAVAPPPMDGDCGASGGTPRRQRSQVTGRTAARAFAAVRAHVWETVHDARPALFAPLRCSQEGGSTPADGGGADSGLAGAGAGAEPSEPALGADASGAGDDEWLLPGVADAALDAGGSGAEGGAAAAWRRRSAVMAVFRERRAAATRGVTGRQWELPSLPAWELHGFTAQDLDVATASMAGAWRCVDWAAVTPEIAVRAVIESGLAEDASRLLGGAASPTAAAAPPQGGSSASVTAPAHKDSEHESESDGSDGDGAGRDAKPSDPRDQAVRLAAAKRLVEVEGRWRSRMATALMRVQALPLAARLVSIARGGGGGLPPVPASLSAALLPPLVLPGSHAAVMRTDAPGGAEGAGGAAGLADPAAASSSAVVPLPWKEAPDWVRDALALSAVDEAATTRPGVLAALRSAAVATASALFARRMAEAGSALAAAAYAVDDGGAGPGSTAMGRAATRYRLFVERLRQGGAGAGDAGGKEAASRAAAAAGLPTADSLCASRARAKSAAAAAGPQGAAESGGDAAPPDDPLEWTALASFDVAVLDLGTGPADEAAQVAVAGPLASTCLRADAVAEMRSSMPPDSMEECVRAGARPAAEDDAQAAAAVSAACSGCSRGGPWVMQRLDGSPAAAAPSRHRHVVVVGPARVTLPRERRTAGEPDPTPSPSGDAPPPSPAGPPAADAPPRAWCLPAVPARVCVPLVAHSVVLQAPVPGPSGGDDDAPVATHADRVLGGVVVRVFLRVATHGDLTAYAGGIIPTVPGPVGLPSGAVGGGVDPTAGPWESPLAPPLTGVPRLLPAPALLLPPRSLPTEDTRVPGPEAIAAIGLDRGAKLAAATNLGGGETVAPWEACFFPRAAAAGIVAVARSSELGLVAASQADDEASPDDAAGASPGHASHATVAGLAAIAGQDAGMSGHAGGIASGRVRDAPAGGGRAGPSSRSRTFRRPRSRRRTAAPPQVDPRADEQAGLPRWRNHDADYGAVSARDTGVIWRGAVPTPEASRKRAPPSLAEVDDLD